MKTFCKYPWNSLAISPIGEYRICCASCVDGKNVILNENKNPYLIYETSPNNVYNTSTYFTIRNQLLSNQKPDICKNCFDTEDARSISPRQEWNNKTWSEDENNYYSVETDIKKIKHLDLRLGNLCNLKCRMCNPQTSSQWVDEWNNIAAVLQKPLLSEKQKIKLKDNSWVWNEKTWKSLEEVIDSVEEISLTGGEPTLATSQYQLYDIIFNKKLENNITLKIFTNVTNIPDKMLEYWKRFKKVILTFSIDAYGDLNKYIRYPTDWNTIEKNIDKYSKYDNIYFRVNTVIQMYNILYLNRLFDWIIEKKIFDEIVLSVLKDPIYLDIRVLPEPLKKIATDRLSSFVGNKTFIRNNFDQIDQIITEMNSQDLSQELNKFFTFTSSLDFLREENLLHLIPEFSIYKQAWLTYVKNYKKLL